MRFTAYDLELEAPDGFQPLTRTGDGLHLYHKESGKTAYISGLFYKVDSSREHMQGCIDYECARFLREREREMGA